MLFQRNNQSLVKMFNNTYLQNLLKNYRPSADLVVFMSIWSEVQNLANSWAGSLLNEACASGSYAKGTAIRGGTDFDFFLSLKDECTNSLKEIYDSLYSFLVQQRLNPRKQNVSIGINLQGKQIDFVPGKKQNILFEDHSLYKFKLSSWTKTNIKTHIDLIKSSGRSNEIKLLKIWRKCQNLDFPSFYLELMVLETFNHPFDFLYTDLDSNLLKVLDFITANIESKIIQDPANSANFLSDDLLQKEKKLIANRAAYSANQIRLGKINEVIW